MSQLTSRLSEECASLACLSAEIQSEIGPSIKTGKGISSRTLRAFQGIDRIEQTLRDVASLMAVVSDFAPAHSIPRGPLEQVMVLKHLRSKLMDDHDTSFLNDDNHPGEISWF
ncbi:hypothetical protein ACP2AV_07630 [Aliiroseovarius sp. PTFE2010]|uniref:hypothetical protein n=1 Tax=Aliiroseovarius sp. PTFE2010 TaxID=3417190 RepID=UPI003CF7101E